MSPVSLPLLALERPLVECRECGRCCKYVGVGINPPDTPRHATDVLWYLYHELEWLRETKPRTYAKIEKGFVPKALRLRPVATPQTARAARRRAVARKART